MTKKKRKKKPTPPAATAKPRMRPALSVASECAPLVKTGGLADVAGALPAAMRPHGWELATLLPGYPAVLSALPASETVLEIPDLFGGSGRVLAAHTAGLDLLVLDAPHLYGRDGGPYSGPDGADWPDNPERFAALCAVAARIGRDGVGGGAGAAPWRPEVLHLHDWQAGLTPFYLGGPGPDGARPGILMTVHNIAFHGLVDAQRLHDLGLPADGFGIDGFEFYGRISALKAGLVGADHVSTVSPTYARELLTPAFGMGFDGLLRNRVAQRPDSLSGILNGIDLSVWDPATDPELASTYTDPADKAANRTALLHEFGLRPGPGPVAVVVSRLTTQKGLDVLLDALPALTSRGGRLLLLGSGDPTLESAWRARAAEDPAVGVHIGYDEKLAHRMVGGGDAILVPSRFEPCGLTQLYGLRYGTVPVVARTGGLADSVIDANDAALRAGAATGIHVDRVTAADVGRGLERLCDLHAEPDLFRSVQRAGMRHDVGWDRSALQYAALYARIAAVGIPA